jgi:hypothetical protein
MSNDRPKLEPMPIVEATVSNMWEIAAIVEERKRLRYANTRDGLPHTNGLLGNLMQAGQAA